jgi:hypothetical protein
MQILTGGKGTFSLFLEEGIPTSEIEGVLKTKETRSQYKVSQTQSGVNYSKGGKMNSQSLLTEIVNAGTNNVLMVMGPESCSSFVPVLKEKLGAVDRKVNHFTCEVAPKKLAALGFQN